MAAYDLEEQEQLAEIKAWWKQHGDRLTWLLLAAAIAVLAWQGWQWYQRSQANQAAAIYGVLQRAALGHDTQKTKAAAGELVEKFPRTAYAPLAAMNAAKVLFDAGDLKSAQVQLAWVAEHGKDEMRDLARLRLASVLLDQQAYEDALKALEPAHGAAFDARYAELRGDVLTAQGKKTDAAAAYRAALAAVDAAAKDGDLQRRAADAAYRPLLQEKLDALGVPGDAK